MEFQVLLRKAVVTKFDEALRLVKKTNCNSSVFEKLAKKSLMFPLVFEKIDNRAANILKQESLRVGADAAVCEDVSKFKKGTSDAVLFATENQIEKLITKLSIQPFGLKQIALQIKDILLANSKKFFSYKNKKIDLTSPIVMGIINVTPDSFSGDGITDPDIALKRAIDFEESGAKIIDIGAESTRPGSDFIDAKTEIQRLLPALKKIRKVIKIPISIDTYKYETAKAVLAEGADIINDIFALREGKDKLASLIREENAGLILMHAKGKPKNMQKNPSYKNCVSEIYEFLAARKEYALKFAIKEENIAVDPGPGFGKVLEHNVELVKNMSVFSSLGAVVGAVSRKRFVREICSNDKTSFVALNILTAFCGADIIRTHDVKETVESLKIIKFFRRV
ncbi:MAG: dihydropteroate synthase [Elusimicrobiota bacterium]|jgi:dihydropteroate synthase|nr:dihydropteroate synthase [Elusimicrobiota bacterium]